MLSHLIGQVAGACPPGFFLASPVSDLAASSAGGAQDLRRIECATMRASCGSRWPRVENQSMLGARGCAMRAGETSVGRLLRDLPRDQQHPAPLPKLRGAYPDALSPCQAAQLAAALVGGTAVEAWPCWRSRGGAASTGASGAGVGGTCDPMNERAIVGRST